MSRVSSSAPRRRLALVSMLAHRPRGPRPARSRALAEAFEESWDVELFAKPDSGPRDGALPPARASRLRRLANNGVRAVLLDRWEPWSRKELGRWKPDVDAGLLIGFPFSPLVVASGRLIRSGIPYVVDAGDPWTLTAAQPASTLLGLRRARKGEQRLWEHAAGAVLTTPEQAERLAALFPRLPILVRPNGYEPFPETDYSTPRAPGDPAHLRLVHFGKLERHRVDVRGFLTALRATGPWERITFSQYGDDFSDMIDAALEGVEIERHPAQSWGECIRRSRTYDLAVVVGNVDPTQLPSKAIEYLTLPVPRLAVTHPSSGDALGNYARERPGWLAVSGRESDLGQLVARHARGPWAADQLRPPVEEGWPRVSRQIVDFLERCLSA